MKRENRLLKKENAKIKNCVVNILETLKTTDSNNEEFFKEYEVI